MKRTSGLPFRATLPDSGVKVTDVKDQSQRPPTGIRERLLSYRSELLIAFRTADQFNPTRATRADILGNPFIDCLAFPVDTAHPFFVDVFRWEPVMVGGDVEVGAGFDQSSDQFASMVTRGFGPFAGCWVVSAAVGNETDSSAGTRVGSYRGEEEGSGDSVNHRSGTNPSRFKIELFT